MKTPYAATEIDSRKGVASNTIGPETEFDYFAPVVE
jgi:hypothetical protein